MLLLRYVDDILPIIRCCYADADDIADAAAAS